jgi:hypothetical protein
MDVLITDYSTRHLYVLEALARKRAWGAFNLHVEARCRSVPDGSSIGVHFINDFLKDGTGGINDLAEHWTTPLRRSLAARPDAWAAVLNEWSYQAAFRCRISAIVTCCGNGKVRVEGVLKCTMRYHLTDKFDNPHDIDGPHETGHNYGEWYWFFGSFTHEFTSRIDYGPTDCGCADKAEDPYANH